MLKFLIAALAALWTLTSNSQSDIYYYDQIRQRDSSRQWERPDYIGNQKAVIGRKTIDLTTKSCYHLNIISRTFLPNNGAIYLCKDAAQHEVTVMLMPDKKMIVYDNADRFLIDLDQPVSRPQSRAVADSD